MSQSSLLLIAAAACCTMIFGTAEAGEVEGLVRVKQTPVVITVGGADADVHGFSSRVIQIAVDALKTRGGGTVRLSPGEYRITAPVRLASNVHLVGSGQATVLKKCDGFKTRFVVDADGCAYHAEVVDASGFETGMGIHISNDRFNGGWDVTTAIITAIDGNTLYFDNRTVETYLASENGIISNAISLVEAVEVENVRIADLLIDGNRDRNEYLNGCRGGGVYIHKARNCTLENVHVTRYNGDSFSAQITENITMRRCEASYGSGLGFHPGTASDSPVIEDCISHHNDQDGIYLCWSVQHGIFRNNRFYANGRFGISIGHKDTDNVFTNNQVYENKQHGVFFRDETDHNSGHRNTFRNNTIENNGTADFQAYGFYITGFTRGVVIEENIIRSTGKGNQVGAVFVGSKAAGPQFNKNNVSGHPGLKSE